MKKIFLGLLIAVGSVFMVSCDQSAQKKTSSKKIKEIALYKNAENPESQNIRISRSSNFDPQEFKDFIQQFVKPGDLVFDVGANVGKTTDLYLSCGASKVISFEPQPLCIKTLAEKYQQNTHVVIEPLGLGAENSSSEMFICSAAPTISTLSEKAVTEGRFTEHGYKWDEKVTIQLTTLDQMIQKHGLPKFCKIDVENYELQVLSGLTQVIPYLSFECNTDHLDTTKKCLDYLTGLGYHEFNMAFGERGLFISPHWLSGEELYQKIKTLMQTHDFSSIWGLWGDIYARHPQEENQI